jgi:hypothetical protein
MSDLEAVFETIDPLLLAQEQALRREYQAREAAYLRAVEEYGVLRARAAMQFRSKEQIEAAFLRGKQTFGKDRERDITAPFLDDISEGLLDAHVLAATYEQHKNELRGSDIDELFGEPSGHATEMTPDDHIEGPPQHVKYMGDYLMWLDWGEGFAEWLAVAREHGMRLAERERVGLDGAAVETGVRQLGVWQTSIGPHEALQSGAIERIVGLDDVSPRPALDKLRDLIGSKRAKVLANRVSQVQGLLTHAPDAWIRQRRAELGPPDAGLDPPSALATLRLEAARSAARKTLIQALEEGHAFSETDPERAAAAQRTAATAQRQFDDVSADLAALPDEGRHLDNWIESGDDRLVRSIMYQDEARRRWYGQAGYLTEFSVVTPPAHVVAVIGDRPETAGTQRDRYDAVTREIEMHRLLTESAEQADMEPPVRSHQEERALQRQIEHVREIGGIESGRLTPGDAEGLGFG